jgi:hypothetical protein
LDSLETSRILQQEMGAGESLKETMSRDVYFEGLKNQISTFWMSADIFHNFWLNISGEN